MLLVAADHPLHILLPLLLQTHQVRDVLVDFFLHLQVQRSIVYALLHGLVTSLQLRPYQLGQVIIFSEGLLLLRGDLKSQVILHLVSLKVIVFVAHYLVAGVFRVDDLGCVSLGG